MSEVMYLSDVPEENKFYVQNGNILRNLEDLAHELSSMHDDTFRHHVNDERNDFYAWVNHCIQDKYLANKIGARYYKGDMYKTVVRRVNGLKGLYHKPKLKQIHKKLTNIVSSGGSSLTSRKKATIKRKVTKVAPTIKRKTASVTKKSTKRKVAKKRPIKRKLVKKAVKTKPLKKNAVKREPVKRKTAKMKTARKK
ncbi:MAG: hypothetical protein KKG59_07415 [Nanoarchaeota archaeon]|nr:hypothetical protein [Nanoarchaeota archaeon]